MKLINLGKLGKSPMLISMLRPRTEWAGPPGAVRSRTHTPLCVRMRTGVLGRWRRLGPSLCGPPWRTLFHVWVCWGCYLCLHCPGSSETAPAPTSGHTQVSVRATGGRLGLPTDPSSTDPPLPSSAGDPLQVGPESAEPRRRPPPKDQRERARAGALPLGALYTAAVVAFVLYKCLQVRDDHGWGYPGPEFPMGALWYREQDTYFRRSVKRISRVLRLSDIKGLF